MIPMRSPLSTTLFFISAIYASTVPACDFSPFFCGQSSTLRSLQLLRLFNDSKVLVDMPMVRDANQTIQMIETFMLQHGNHSREDARRLVTSLFRCPGCDLEITADTHPDWKSIPDVYHRSTISEIRQLVLWINKRWLDLSRKTSPVIPGEPFKHSLIPLPNPFIFPGGRFMEQYYWDTYWTVIGLVRCGMHQTAFGMLRNLLAMQDKDSGLVPNGNRVYYNRRSQPPVLTLIADEMNMTHVLFDHLVKEYAFWQSNRTKLTGFGLVNVYASNVDCERPEAYIQDHDATQNMTDSEKKFCLSEIRAVAESGWDFSSRWMSPNEKCFTVSGIAPVCLNSILCKVSKILAGVDRSGFFEHEYQKRVRTMHQLHWHEESMMWYDYDIGSQCQRRHFYASNLMPIWAGCHNFTDEQVENILLNFANSKHMTHESGVPTSYVNSGFQWDWPNVWPPLQHMLYKGFLLYFHLPIGRELALNVSRKMFRSVYETWKSTNETFEKYSVHCRVNEVNGRKDCSGGGGEYITQPGFAWTNGVIVDMINDFGDELWDRNSPQK